MSTIQAITNSFIAETNEYAIQALLEVGYSPEEARNVAGNVLVDVVADSTNNPVEA